MEQIVVSESFCGEATGTPSLDKKIVLSNSEMWVGGGPSREH